MGATAPPMQAGSTGRTVGGFTYLGALFLITLVGLGLAGAGQAWSVASKRARERELLWAGTQYARAIQAYYEQSPGVRHHPARLEDLLADQRFPVPRHHLRQLYRDPVSRQPFVILPGPDGRIAGVRSRSDELPLKQDGFPARWQGFRGMTRYSDWHFMPAVIPAPPLPVAAPPARGGG